MTINGTNTVQDGDLYRRAVIDALNARKEYYILEHIDALYNKYEADAVLEDITERIREENVKAKK